MAPWLGSNAKTKRIRLATGTRALRIHDADRPVSCIRRASNAKEGSSVAVT